MAAQVRFIGENGQHRYLLEGTELPGMTEVLRAAGLSGSPFYKQEHRDRGSRVHKVICTMCKRPWRGSSPAEIISNSPWDVAATRPAALVEEVMPYAMGAALYLLESGFQPQIVEAPVASTRLRVAGTLDAWGMLGGKRTLIDWKTGHPEDAAVGPQTAGYAEMLKESRGLETDQRIVVWLKPDGAYKAFPPQPAGGIDLAIATAAATLYHWRRKHNRM